MGMFNYWILSGLIIFGLLIIYALFRNRSCEWGKFGLNVISGLFRYFIRYYHQAELQRLNLPEHGPALVASNHVSGLDPILLIAATSRPLRFIIAHEQYDRFYLKWLFRYSNAIRVNRDHLPERAVRSALRALRKGEVVVIYPQGKIHLDSEPPEPMKRGVLKLSEWTGAPIYPCRIDGVKGEGEIITALYKRGTPQLRVEAPVLCYTDKEQECQQYLLNIIEKRS